MRGFAALLEANDVVIQYIRTEAAAVRWAKTDVGEGMEEDRRAKDVLHVDRWRKRTLEDRPTARRCQSAACFLTFQSCPTNPALLGAATPRRNEERYCRDGRYRNSKSDVGANVGADWLEHVKPPYLNDGGIIVNAVDGRRYVSSTGDCRSRTRRGSPSWTAPRVGPHSLGVAVATRVNIDETAGAKGIHDKGGGTVC